MPTPRETVWPLDDHTRGKHLVLRNYLNAWLPILGGTRGRVIFIDGFAGPGEYTNGEDGSPVIALKALVEHSARARMSDARFLFIEASPDRADHLEALLNARFPDLPIGWKWEVVPGECAPIVLGLLSELERDGARIAPSFMMLDPFGVKGVPIELVRQFLAHPRTEVYVSFMYDSFRRFDEQPEFERHLDELFGVATWRETLAHTDPQTARRATYALYEACLRTAGARFVLHFDIYRGGRLIYSVFFATNHLVGCDRMKQAMWRAAPDGSFQFRGQGGGQMVLDIGGPNYNMLREDLLAFIRSREKVDVRDVEEFLQSDRSLFHCAHPYKTKGLKVLEQEGRVVAERTVGTRQGTFPDGTTLRAVS